MVLKAIKVYLNNNLLSRGVLQTCALCMTFQTGVTSAKRYWYADI